MNDHNPWPIFVQDRGGRPIYLTQERWAHALDHPGMNEELLDCVLATLSKGQRQQDAYDPAKFKYNLCVRQFACTLHRYGCGGEIWLARCAAQSQQLCADSVFG